MNELYSRLILDLDLMVYCDSENLNLLNYSKNSNIILLFTKINSKVILNKSYPKNHMISNTHKHIQDLLV